MTDSQTDNETTERHREPKALCYFEGDTVVRLAAELREYAPATSRVFVLKQGDKYFLQVKSTTGNGGPPLNVSHPCPGSPGC